MSAVLSIIIFDSYRNQLSGASTHSISPRTLLNVLAAFIPATTKAWRLDGDQFMAMLGCHLSDGVSWNERTVTHLARLKTNEKIEPEDDTDDESDHETSSDSGSISSAFASNIDYATRINADVKLDSVFVCASDSNRDHESKSSSSRTTSMSDFNSNSGSESESEPESDPLPERPIPTASGLSMVPFKWLRSGDRCGH
jgi:hypothetical protein